MGIENVREYLKKWGRDADIIEFSASSATVELAARALDTREERIAKTLSFNKNGTPMLIVTAGNMKIDNRKYKATFGCKARMLSPSEVREMIGHEIGGVCPFGIHEGVEVYLDVSLKKYDYIFPACGSSHSAIRMSCEELEETSQARAFVDICVERNG